MCDQTAIQVNMQEMRAEIRRLREENERHDKNNKELAGIAKRMCEENERLKKEWNDMRDENDEAGRRAGKAALWRARARELLDECLAAPFTKGTYMEQKIRAFLDGEDK